MGAIQICFYIQLAENAKLGIVPHPASGNLLKRMADLLQFGVFLEISQNILMIYTMVVAPLLSQTIKSSVDINECRGGGKRDGV